MTRNQSISRRSSRQQLWKLVLQTTGAVGVFCLVIAMLMGSSEIAVRWQPFLRESFTTDADLAPVVQFFHNSSMDSLSEDAVRVDAAVAPIQEMMAVPVSGKVISQYGWDQTTPVSDFQKGLWIAATQGEEIRAAYQGTVTQVKSQENGRYIIEVSHANGLITVYGDCVECSVMEGMPVQKGQSIGKVADNGGEDEGNFYFAARYLGEPINPMELLRETSQQ